MWVVIVFACLTVGTCGFIDSPPVYSQSECEIMKARADKMLDADPMVSTYLSKCIQIQMSEAAIPR
jgi:hypothetical protein